MALVKRDYYEVLGVPRDADEATIKRAFHELARDWHPDVADTPAAEARFRELAEAYSVLSRREARVLYDRFGYRGRGNALFEDEASGLPRGDNVEVDLELRSFEVESGARRVVAFDAAVRCAACEGRGSRDSPNPDCEHCEGSGRKSSVSLVDAAHVVHFELCPACVSEPCPTCDGTGTIETRRRLRLRIPPHTVDDGALLRVAGDGNDAGAGSTPGDLLVRVHVKRAAKDPPSVRYGAVALLLVAIAVLALYVLR